MKSKFFRSVWIADTLCKHTPTHLQQDNNQLFSQYAVYGVFLWALNIKQHTACWPLWQIISFSSHSNGLHYVLRLQLMFSAHTKTFAFSKLIQNADTVRFSLHWDRNAGVQTLHLSPLNKILCGERKRQRQWISNGSQRVKSLCRLATAWDKHTHTHTKHTVIDSVSIGCPGFALTANVAGRETDVWAKRENEKKEEESENRHEIERDLTQSQTINGC